jgi:hypothetical protein
MYNLGTTRSAWPSSCSLLSVFSKRTLHRVFFFFFFFSVSIDSSSHTLLYQQSTTTLLPWRGEEHVEEDMELVTMRQHVMGN